MADDIKASAAASQLSVLGASKGGKARAESMTAAERSESARKAVSARWAKAGVEIRTTPAALFGSADRPVRIAGAEIACYVLDDGRRVLAQRGLQAAIGMSEGGGTGGAQRVARFIEALRAKGLDISDLALRIASPVLFRPAGAGSPAYGYEATILPELCAVISEAYQRGLLQKQQTHIGVQCNALLRALAKTAIIALIDEATGYQDFRDREALQSILDRFLAKELAAWAKRFPDEFYQQIFRLRDWKWKGMKVNRPQVVGHYTKDLVYRRLLPDLLKRLETKNPEDDRGHRRAKHHQWLTDDVGHPVLAQHLHAVTTLMKASDTWDQFMGMMNKSLPYRTSLKDLPLFEAPND
jgi:hypothetical protein